MGIGTQELIIILVIVLLLFGAKKLPELARGLGRSIGEFRNAQQDVKEQFEKAMHEAKKKKENDTTEKKEDS